MEKELVEEYTNVLSEEWHVYPEIWGVSKISGKSKRIDAVIIHKQQPHMKFGIEFKRVDLGAFNNFTAWFKQTVTYTQCEFGSMGKIPILIAPSINYKDSGFEWRRLLGEFGIGEIEKFYHKSESRWVYKIKHKDTTVWTNNGVGFNPIALKQNFQQYLEF